MFFSTEYFLSLTLILMDIKSVSMDKEPVCSKFAYEEQMLEKMIRTEIKVETMVNEIKTTQDNVLKTLDQITKNIADFTERFVVLRENITDEMTKRGEELKNKSENPESPTVAFHAHHLTTLKLDTVDEILVFHTTITNEGTSYDTSTGIFTAPVGGIYEFIVHICARASHYAYISLVLESTAIATDSNYDAKYNTCNSFGAIVRVRTGEKVWVKSNWGHSSKHSLLEDKYRMNTFSGILIKT